MGLRKKLSFKSKKNVERLLELTESSYCSIRMEALERCELLFYEKEYKKIALHRTLEGLKDKEDLVRITCIENLMFWDHKEATPKIRKTLWDQDQLVRVFSAEALAQFEDKESIPELERLLNNAETYLEEGACLFALWFLGEEQYFEQMLNGFKNGDIHTKIRFANAYAPEIAKRGGKKRLIQLIKGVMKKGDPPSVKEALEKALKRLS